ncbi:MAG TPA: dihydroorotase [Candidatus Binatia bacterium]|nr:dihydroorotase [Candidatus Binatia bacterium]
MNCILRGVRVIDPLGRRDALGQDVWLSEGRIIAIYKHMGEGTLPVIDLTPPAGGTPVILCPGFIDVHTHLREPGDEGAETLHSGSQAAAAGGFTHVLAMANTVPPIDTPERVKEATFRAVAASVQVLTGCALTRGLQGQEMVDLETCAAAGAVAFSDDGRNAFSPRLLSEAISQAAPLHRPILVHPEDEDLIAQVNNVQGPVNRCPLRPVEAEVKAVDYALRALAHAGRGHVHLQHISSAAAVERVRRAKEEGATVTAEATPHHLGMWLPFASEPDPSGLLKVNPPLRTDHDREALIQALRDGIIDAVATDHAPHRVEEKALPYEKAAPGMIGLELALAACITLAGMDGDWLPTLIERLTIGPYRVLGGASGLREPRLRIGEAATCVLFDPAAEWTVEPSHLRSSSQNTPLIGVKLRGRVLMTLVDGALVHHDRQRLPWPVPSPAPEAVHG